MLRITQQDSAQGAKRYYSSADYLSEGQELVGRWGGEAAAKMGLTGEVDKVAFERLCDNLHPSTRAALTVRTRTDRTVGYDFTFSVPKSVSLLFALKGDPEILEAFREAVAETMQDIESEMKTRVRKGGRNEDRVTGNMVWAEFVHTTSRPVGGVPDPQLHAHCFAFNSTWDEAEQRFKAGQFRGLKADAPYFQAGFRVRLANKLQALGFAIERKRDDFEIAGIGSNVLKRFSRRTTEIEKAAAELGITDPDRKAELGATTREKKTKAMSWVELLRSWDDRLSPVEREQLTSAYRREIPGPPVQRGEAQVVDYAIDHLFSRESVVTERKLFTEALKRGVGSVTIGGVGRELARRPLIAAEQDGRRMVSTPDILAEEKRLIAFARGGRGRLRPLVSADRPITRQWLNSGQKAAVRHVLGSRDRISIVRGAAGTGKTTLEQEIGEALAEARIPVVALAPSTKAVAVLRDDAELPSAQTVAHFQRNEAMQNGVRGGVILVDEASLLGTRDLVHLAEIAGKQSARLVLVGDRRQNRAVSRGEPLRLLEAEAGLPVAEVTEILRQSGDYKRAVHAFSEGDVRTGLAELDRLGWVRELGDGDRYRQLAEAYRDAIGEPRPGGKDATALVVSPTHAESARITASIRAMLKEEGKLTGGRRFQGWVPAQLTDAQKSDATWLEPGDLIVFQQNAPGFVKGTRIVIGETTSLPLQHAKRFEVFKPRTLELAAGDRIRMTAGGTTKDGNHRLSNGAILTVAGFTPRGDLVVDHGWVIDKDKSSMNYGYCVTAHASQGATVDKVLIGLSSESFPATNRRSAYVAVSRGRSQALIFTDDKKALLKAAERPDEPLSAVDLLKARPMLFGRLRRHLAFQRRAATFAEIAGHIPIQEKERRAQHER